MDRAFRDGEVAVTGTAITKVLPPSSRFDRKNTHAIKKGAVLEKLSVFFERFYGLTS